jgi:2-methylcitrate dehydratase PrpD
MASRIGPTIRPECLFAASIVLERTATGFALLVERSFADWMGRWLYAKLGQSSETLPASTVTEPMAGARSSRVGASTWHGTADTLTSMAQALAKQWRVSDPNKSLATRLAAWAAGLSPNDLPPEVVIDVRLRLLDTLGTMLAARHTPMGRAVCSATAALGSGNAAQIVGTKNFNTSSLAALANGTLAHALDFDDTHNPSVMHPSAVSVPTALAMTQAGGLGGADLVMAIAIGNEIGCRLGLVAPGAFHDVGQHPTSVLGTSAAAIVAGRLLGLDAEHLAWAIGISASQGSGVLEAYSDGTWSKTLHPGWAAHAGIVAATLAKFGFTGPPSGLDGRYGLFPAHIQQMADRLDYAAATKELGVRWHMLDAAFKLYPCAHSIHAFVEAALALRLQHDIVPDHIAEVVLEIPSAFVGQIAEPRGAKLTPSTTTHARASVLYAVAAVLAHGSLGMADYTDEAIVRREVLALCRRIHHRVQTKGDGPIRFSGSVAITTRDGRVLSLTIEEADGTGARRLKPDRIEAKFRIAAGGSLRPADIKSLTALCRTVETLTTIDRLLAATAPSANTPRRRRP